MTDWHVFSTTGMKDITDHGVVLSLSDLKWAKEWAWAPDCEIQEKWYLFYHNADLAIRNIPEGSTDRKYIHWRRSVCIDYLEYNPDGTIKKVIPTKDGVARVP
jgi:hypothetical protein